jgi:polyhydroxybutyrate depolymerase
MSSFVRIIALSGLMFSILTMAAVASPDGQAVTRELVVNGSVRSYSLYIPSEADKKGVPLMIVLHGGLGNAKIIERMSGMDSVADKGGFIVAYPEGTGIRFNPDRRTWNAGLCCNPAVRENIDDVSFISKMIDDISTKYSIDTGRVYVAGLSNGAMMAYRLACDIPGKIAAVIAVSGTLAVDNCDRAKNIPVLHIHGDQDRNVPFNGGRGEEGLSGVSHRSVPETMNLLIRARHCSAPEKTMSGDIEISSYKCSDGAPVMLYLIKGGAHGWPGSRRWKAKSSAQGDISGSQLAWEFARQFSKNQK